MHKVLRTISQCYIISMCVYTTLGEHLLCYLVTEPSWQLNSKQAVSSQ